ncbi:hypothetical protein KOR42_49860 [Thalassoglobus neptunius]|uniref:Cytochrome C n=2 Tax=Thalassoglobus neptunius TaxID=1938619 RepID=A0A5C5VNH9_9PLAN|nr:hypothetical protein KOR42_49860 [Thalassoglobus neptunius]
MQNKSIRIPLAFAAIMVASSTLTGCPQTSTPDSATTNVPSENTPAPSTPAAQSNTNVSEVDPNRKETQWIGTIPYDVFYDQPLTIAADSTSLSANSPDTTTQEIPEMPPENTSETPSTDTSPSVTSTEAVNWTEILPLPILIDETKRIRNRLSENLQTVGTYNKSINDISLDGAMMTALGAIATVHPEDDDWKNRAKFVRDLGYEIYMAADGTGRTAFTATEEPYLKLITALDGGTVNDVEADEVVDFADIVYVSDIMKRIDESINDLKANINTESRLKEDSEKTEQELRVLAALATIMSSDGYDSADSELYQKLTGKFIDGALSSVKAVKTENYEGFREGLNQMQSTCAECHQQFRSNSSSF